MQALEWSMNKSELGEFTLPLVLNLIRYWSRRNLLDDAMKYGNRAPERAPGQDFVGVQVLLGISAFRKKWFKEASAHYAAALDESKRTGFVLGEAASECNLAMILGHEGNHEESAVTYTRGLALFRKIGDRRRLAGALSGVAHDLLVAAQSDPGNSRSYLEQAEDYLAEADALKVEDPGILQ